MQSAKKSEHLRMRREVARRVKGLMGERRSEIMSWPAPAYLWWYAGHAVLILDYTLCYCIPSNTKNLSMQTDMHFKYYPSFIILSWTSPTSITTWSLPNGKTIHIGLARSLAHSLTVVLVRSCFMGKKVRQLLKIILSFLSMKKVIGGFLKKLLPKLIEHWSFLFLWLWRDSIRERKVRQVVGKRRIFIKMSQRRRITIRKVSKLFLFKVVVLSNRVILTSN